jgi:DNA-binding MarR family transcriptional regulator
MRPRPGFESSTGFLLSQLGVRATRSWTAMLARFDLTPHHHAILLVLRHSGPLGLGRLAAIVSVDPRNMGPVLDPLEGRGAIERIADPSDRRRRAVALTPEGSRLAGELAAAADEIEAEFLSALSPAKREELRGLLLQLWG